MRQVERAAPSWKDPIKTAASAAPDGSSSAAYIPSAFVAAARLQQSLGTTELPPPPRREKATALYDFVPQDTSTQLRLRKGDTMEILRKDADGWWFVRLNGEKGLVPGSYLQVEAPPAPVDPAILAAREASNQRFLQWRRSSLGTTTSDNNSTVSIGSDNSQRNSGVEYESPLGLGVHSEASVGSNSSNGVDARASIEVEDKPKVVRRLKKCAACNETILGRTKRALGGELFHEIAYHVDCAEEIIHCRVCDKEILGRAYKTAGASFHKLCMVCSSCQKQVPENGAILEDDSLVCNACIAERKRKEEEAIAAAKAAEAARLAKLRAEEEARAAAQRRAEEEARAAEQAKAEEEARLAAEAKAEEARLAEEKAKAEAAAAEAEAERLAQEASRLSILSQSSGPRGSTLRTRSEDENESLAPLPSSAAKGVARSSFVDASSATLRQSTLSALDQFDLGAVADVADHGQERLSEDMENDYGGSFLSLGGERDSLRLSQVIDFGAVEEFNASATSNRERLSGVSDVSSFSEFDDLISSTVPRGVANGGLDGAIPEHQETDADNDEDGERCGGCAAVLEGEAIGALNQYYHPECFKCGHCQRVIAEDQGYAEKDTQAFHQECYQARFGKRCSRCNKNLKGKVVKALDSLYHPDCFVCYQCNASLSESFFEHEGQAVCAQCKHLFITANAVQVPDNLIAISVATVGYHFAAQDETQLTIAPGQQVSVLQKDEDGWWFVDLEGQRGYVPGSYLIEHPEPPQKSPQRLGRGLAGSSSSSSSSSPWDPAAMWERVQPSLWHPVAALEQSLLELDKATAGMLSAPFRLTQAVIPRLSGQHDADSFFQDLVPDRPTKNKSRHKSGTAQTHAKPPPTASDSASSSFATYSYSSATVVDDTGRRISSVRRRYEDSMGRLKAEHERELDGRWLKTIWRRQGLGDEGQHETITSDGGPAEAFEEAWRRTPFGRADAKDTACEPKLSGESQDTDARKPEGVRQAERASEHVTPGPDYEAAERAPEKQCGEEGEGVTEEAQHCSREEAIARGSKNQEEETTPPEHS
ncbi:hypothetical protein ATCC90586_008935 [Pythium insidiosum]|nr:hypothetical protein ATCC90586_008935 [Pythium insidiosum]